MSNFGERDQVEEDQAIDATTIREAGPELVTPALEGRHVFLKTLEPTDYPFLRMLETGGELAMRWRLRGATPSPEVWAHDIWAGVLAQFLVIARRRQEPIGVVALYDADFRDGHAKLAVAKFEPSNRSPLMMLGMGLFLDYVFDCWDLHKLYADVPEYNYAQFESGAGRFFAVEGRLKSHTFLAGRRWDRLVLAIYRDQWREEAGALSRTERLR